MHSLITTGPKSLKVLQDRVEAARITDYAYLMRARIAQPRCPAVLALVLMACACSHGPAPGTVWHEPVTGMELLWIGPTRFRMGSEPGEPGRQADEVPHQVELTRGFSLGRFEVTQGQWLEVMGENPSQHAACGLACPVETVSFLDVQAFIARLEARSPGSRFRLPTEAEWELACRAGTTTPFSTGNDLTPDQANFDGRYPYPPRTGSTTGSTTDIFRGSPAPVGSYAHNPWGFFDMHGNVWEWCADWYGPYPSQPARDPRGPATGALRVIRGGSWCFDANSARSALRYTHAPGDDGYSLGLRLVREPARQGVPGSLRQITAALMRAGSSSHRQAPQGSARGSQNHRQVTARQH